MANKIIADLTAEVAADRTVMGSATILINGFQTRLDAAIAAAIANGASEAEVAPLADLSAGLAQDRTALASAVSANTQPTPASARVG
jgi:hypothetical protein